MLPARDTLQGILYEVVEHAPHLIGVGKDLDAFSRSLVADCRILAHTEEVDCRLYLRSYVHPLRDRPLVLGDIRELRGDGGQLVDLLYECRRRLPQYLLEVVSPRIPYFYEVLDRQLHRRQRVLYLVGYLPGHLAPRRFSLRRRQLLRRACQLVCHPVVLRHDLSYLVVILIVELDVLAPEVHLAYPVAQRLQRERDASHEEVREDYRHQRDEQQRICDRVERREELSPRQSDVGEVRDVEIAYDLVVRREYRRIE